MEGYEETFATFDANNGRFVFTWNWAAFVFGVFWYFYKGLWPKALIYLAALIIISSMTHGFAFLPIWATYAILANYDLYLYQRKGTQLWEGAGFENTTRTPDTRSVASSLEVRLQKLVEIKAQGLITEEEYEVKRARLTKEAENGALLKKLDEALRLGLLNEEEYEAKRATLLA